MTVWVVMGNDFPEAVFSSEEAADKFCEEAKKQLNVNGEVSRIYWRHYKFKVQK